MPALPRILIVEDQPALAALVQQRLQEQGYHCERAGDGITALKMILSTPFALLLLDLQIPGLHGIELLRKLRASRLRARLLEACGDSAPLTLTDRQLHSALGLLKGRGVRMPEDPLPIPEPYREGEFPYSVRIACASDSGERLDGIFSNCARFLIYQISPRETRLVDLREPGPGRDDEDRHARRAELLSDCQLLYTLSIGGPAAAKVVRAGVHPVRLARAQPAREIVEELQRVLATAPPPWLAKAMGAEPDQRVRFTQ